MNDLDDEVRQVLAPLRSGELKAVGLGDPPRRQRLREDVRRLVADVPDRRRRLRQRRVVAWALGAAVAAAAGVAAVQLGTGRSPRPGSRADLVELRVLEGNASRSLGDDVRPVAGGDSLWTAPEGRIETAAGSRTELQTPAGLRVAIGESTTLAMNLYPASPDPWLELTKGNVRCQVPHLAPGGRLGVRTPDAEVVVHGTVFSVDVRARPDGGVGTCVRVEEGVVSVLHARQTERLGPAQSWGCSDAAPPARPIAAAPASSLAAAPPAGTATRSSETRSAAVARPLIEGLAEQNRLFQVALSAESKGDDATAKVALEQLLERYPRSPLSPDVKVALARIKARMPPQ